MKFDDLQAGTMRECVDLYRIENNHDGAGGYTRDPVLQQGNMRVAWEDRTPTSTVQGAQMAAQIDAQAGMAKSVDVRPDDWVVHQGDVYRVIRSRKRGRSRWQIVALEYVDVWDAATQGVK